MPVPLILASGSPRRRDLLHAHGIEFAVVPAEVAEVAPAHLTARETTLFNARAKSRFVAAAHPHALVLGADTLVAFEGEMLGKPASLAAAFAMAKRLSGRAHEVYSGVWLTHAESGCEHGFVELTRVYFRQLSDAQIRAYLARIEPLDKAGAYAAQVDRGEFIERVEGSFTNVIGLPMESLAEALRHFD